MWMVSFDKRWIWASVAAVAVGVLAYVASSAMAAGRLFGDRVAEVISRMPFWWPLLQGLPLMIPASAFLGFIVPRGFWLWGGYCRNRAATSDCTWNFLPVFHGFSQTHRCLVFAGYRVGGLLDNLRRPLYLRRRAGGGFEMAPEPRLAGTQ